MTFYSIPGLQANGERAARPQPTRAELAADPRFKEYYDAIDQNPDLLVQETGVEGFHRFRGDACLVRNEERNQDGSITQEIQRSDPGSSGTYYATWEQTGRGRLTLTRTRRVFS